MLNMMGKHILRVAVIPRLRMAGNPLLYIILLLSIILQYVPVQGGGVMMAAGSLEGEGTLPGFYRDAVRPEGGAGEMIVRLCGLDDDSMRRIVRMKLTVEGREGDCLDVRVREKQLEGLREMFRAEGGDVDIDILVEDTSYYVEEMLGPGGKGTYHEYTDLLAELLQLAQDYPGIARLDTLGESHEGRKILCMKVSDNVEVDETEAEILFDGTTHGDEWITEEVVLFMTRYLIENYGFDPTVTALVENREIFLVPMVNPDGVTDRSRYNAAGVDLNRDYGYQWEGWGGSGSPFSQPELRAMWSLHQDRQYTICISYHSGTEFISLPWSYHPDRTMDHDHYSHISQLYSSPSGYSYGQGYHSMYEIHGSSKDTFYGCVGALGWTIEVSYTKTPPAADIEYYCEKNREGMLILMENAGKGVWGTVRDLDTGEPLQAIVTVREIDWSVFTDPEVGDFHKFLLPGTYSLHVQAPGHLPVTVEDVPVDGGEAICIDVDLQADGSGAFAFRTVSCYTADPYDAHANHSLTPWSLGFPDNVSLSIGVEGWIVQDLGAAYEVIDQPGYDFIVYEGDLSDEGFSVYGGSDCHGPWYLIGSGTGTTEFDLQGSGLSRARYLKVVDDGDGSPSDPFAGMELDAIVVASQPEGVCLNYQGSTLDDSLGGNDNGVPEVGEMVDIRVILVNNGLTDAPSVYALLSSDDPHVTVRKDSSAYGDIGSGETGASELTYKVKVSEDCPDPHYPELLLDIRADGGYIAEASFDFAVGSPGFSDDVEGPVSGWTHYPVSIGYLDEWHVSTLRCHGGSHSWKCGNTGAGDYSDYDDSGLETPPLLVAPGSTLRFWHWIDAEIEDVEWAWDGSIVEASTDGGFFWTQIEPVGGYPYKIVDNPASPFPAGTPCYSGMHGWTQETFELGPTTGELLVRFRFGSDGYITEEGWFIDDIEVEVPPAAVTGNLVSDTDLVPRGEDLGYTIELANTTDQAQTVTVYTDLTLPSGIPYPGNPYLGPFTLTLGAYQSASRHFTERVPGIAPLGFYSYRLIVEQQGAEVDRDAFQFEVIP